METVQLSKCLLLFLQTKICNFKLLFHAVKKKYKCVNKFFSQKERWMPNLRRQTRRSAVWGWFDKTFYKQFPKGLLLCTSKLQVLRCHLQVNLQMNLQVHLSALMSVLFV